MKKILTALILLHIFAVGLFSQTKWEINESSRVDFKIGNMWLMNVKGQFDGMKGQIIFDPTNLEGSSFRVCIDATSVNTSNDKRDDHLREDDFFYVKKYPLICFYADDVVQNKSGYLAKGQLMLHGESQEVAMPFTFQNNEFKGQLKLDRRDYNIGPDFSSFTV